MVDIAIIVGSTRPGRAGADVAAWVHEHAAGRQDANFEVVDLADFDLSTYDEPIPPSVGQPYTTAHAQAWSSVIDRFDGYVFVVPEYNHSFPGSLKNAIDFLYREWNDKAAGIVSYGASEGIRAAEQLRLVAAELQLATVRAQVGLSLYTDFVGFTRFEPQELRPEQLDVLLDQLIAWSGALATLRVESKVA